MRPPVRVPDAQQLLADAGIDVAAVLPRARGGGARAVAAAGPTEGAGLLADAPGAAHLEAHTASLLAAVLEDTPAVGAVRVAPGGVVFAAAHLGQLPAAPTAASPVGSPRRRAGAGGGAAARRGVEEGRAFGFVVRPLSTLSQAPHPPPRPRVFTLPALELEALAAADNDFEPPARAKKRAASGAQQELAQRPARPARSARSGARSARSSSAQDVHRAVVQERHRAIRARSAGYR